MYSAGPPARAGTGPYLYRAERRAFEGASVMARKPDVRAALRIYLSDLVRPYGLALREDLFEQGGGHSYGEMAEPLIASLVPPDRPVDLLVLAFAMPEVRPGRATAVYLSHVCPGNPLAFAICDQGSAAGFTALRVVREYACRRALVLVVEQAALYYDLSEPAAVPAGHTAVALLCGDHADGLDGLGGGLDRPPGPAGPAAPARFDAVRQHGGVNPERVGHLLAEELAALSAGRTGVTTVLSAALATLAGDVVPDGHALVAPPGRPTTGVWWELAGALGQAHGRRVVLADYDPMLRYLCLAAVDAGSAT